MPTSRPRSLADDLRARSDVALVTLLRARPDLLSPVPSDLASLAARAATRPSVSRALDQLDRFGLQVVEVLCALPDHSTEADVRRLLGADPTTVLDLLHERALVYRDDEGGLVVPRTVAEVVGHPAGLGPAAEQALHTYGPARLSQIATDLGLPAAGDPVATARTVAGVLGDDDRLAALLAQAPAGATDALATMVWGPPTGHLERARRDVRRRQRGQPGRVAARPRAAGRPPTPPPWCCPARWPCTCAAAGCTGRPSRSCPTSPPRRSTPTMSTGRPRAPPPTRCGWSRSCWSCGRTSRRRCCAPAGWACASGPGPRRSWTSTRAGWHCSSRPRTPPGCWPRATTAARPPSCGCRRRRTTAGWTPRSPSAGWRSRRPGWTSTRVPGLVGGRDQRGRTLSPLGPDLDRTVAPAVRTAVLADLAALPTGVATTSESLSARLRWQAPRRGGRLQDDLVTWTVAEARALGLATGGALAGHGRLLAAGAGPAAVTALEAALPPTLDHVLLQADLTAVAPGPLEPALARSLRLVADIESTGGATVYRFTEATVRRAFDAGWTAGDVTGLLARHSRTPVPQPLTYLVDDVGRRHGRVRVGAASSFVRCDDESILGVLLSDRRAASLGLRLIAPTVLASSAPADVVLERLRGMGLAPAAEGPDGAVVVRRPESRRTSARRPPARVVTTPPAPGDALLDAAVQAIRGGDRSRLVGSLRTSRPTADVLAMLTQAAGSGEALWIGYVDAEGRATQRVVEPVAVEGGYLNAYDHLRGAVRSFAVHRITGVSALDEETVS